MISYNILQINIALSFNFRHFSQYILLSYSKFTILINFQLGKKYNVSVAIIEFIYKSLNFPSRYFQTKLE